MKKIYSMVLCLVIGAAALMLGGCAKSVTLSEFIEIKAEGANGYGTISHNVKENELAAEIYGEELKELDMSKVKDLSDAADMYKEYQEEKEEYDKIKKALDDIEVEVDKESKLKNGDVVKVTVKFPEDLEDELDVSFSDTEYEYTVSELKEVKTIDAFAEDVMKIEYEGASPEVSMNISNVASESPANMISYSLGQEGPYKDGDQVTVQAEYDEEELLEEGYVVKESTKTITVASDYKYVAAAADITEDFDKKLQDQALDTIKAYIAEKPVKSMTWTCKGKYVRAFKGAEREYGESQNVIYYVFNGKVKPEEKGYKAKSVNLAVRYNDVIIGKDGTSTYIPSDNAQLEDDGAEYMDVGGWNSIYCYLSEQKLFDSCIQKYTDRYSYEVTGDLKNLG